MWKRSDSVAPAPSRVRREYLYHNRRSQPCGRLIWGDNLCAMEMLIAEGYGERIKLVYMDPPFLSATGYYRKVRIKPGLYLKMPTYPDRLDICSYLDMMRARLVAAHRLLSPDGLLFLHCDWRVNSYIRVLLDEIFGYKNFLNEIVWHYGGRGAKHISSQFPRNHDTIYVYRKGAGGRLKKLYTERLIPLKEALASGYRIDPDGRPFKTAPRGDYTDDSLKRLAEQGRVYVTRNGNIRIKYFLELRSGMVVEHVPLGDVWTDIPDSMHTPKAERTGYRTQKPLKLLERIIECSTEPDELVLDPFGGSGTTAVAAQRLGRRWILCEQSPQGIALTRKRLLYLGMPAFSIERLLDGNTKAVDKPAQPIPIVPHTAVDRDGRIVVELRHNPGIALPEGLGTEDALLLVDYWAIDWNYRDEGFRAEWLSYRDDRCSPIKPVARAASGMIKDNSTGRIAIKVVDLFGTEETHTIEVKKAYG